MKLSGKNGDPAFTSYGLKPPASSVFILYEPLPKQMTLECHRAVSSMEEMLEEMWDLGKDHCGF